MRSYKRHKHHRSRNWILAQDHSSPRHLTYSTYFNKMPPKAQAKKPLPKATATKPLPKTQPTKPLPKKQPTKALPKAQPPKKQPQPPQQQSWITRTTTAAASGVGNFAGAIVSAAGNGVAGAGRGAGSRYAWFDVRGIGRLY
jgi:outer membrane biosynthesis protein TonB